MATKKKGKSRQGRSSRKRTAGSGHSRVVYIHGIGDQLPPVALKREWDLALFGRDMGGQTEMAYWSDILHGTQPRTMAAAGSRSLDVDTLLERAGLGDTPGAQVLADALIARFGVSAGKRRCAQESAAAARVPA